MPNLVFDTRFFVEYFYSAENQFQRRAKEFLATNKRRYVSVVTLHELYLLDMARRGREVARVDLEVTQDLFRVLGINTPIGITAAEFRHRYRMPMGDSLIAATCKVLEAHCVTDDPHLSKMKNIKSRWI